MLKSKVSSYYECVYLLGAFYFYYFGFNCVGEEMTIGGWLMLNELLNYGTKDNPVECAWTSLHRSFNNMPPSATDCFVMVHAVTQYVRNYHARR